MELAGTIQNGVVVFDAPMAMGNGTRVTVIVPEERPQAGSFGERYAEFCGTLSGPEDLADQHDHYRLGTPKR